MCYLAVAQSTLSHCQGDSLTNPMLITAFLMLIWTQRLPWVPKPSGARSRTWTGNLSILNVTPWLTTPPPPTPPPLGLYFLILLETSFSSLCFFNSVLNSMSSLNTFCVVIVYLSTQSSVILFSSSKEKCEGSIKSGK